MGNRGGLKSATIFYASDRIATLTIVSELQTRCPIEPRFISRHHKHGVVDMRAGILALFLMGCGTGDEDQGVDSDALDVEHSDVFAGAPLAETSDGECPKLDSSGTRTFSSGGEQREVIIRFPADKPADMPVMFFWHGLGDSASNIDGTLDMKGFANEHNAVVVIPQSSDPNLMTWNYASGSADVTLYDDMRTCLSQELNVDLNRIASTGFSFGALFTSFLAMERADTLSAVAVMSGGVDAGIGLPYKTPKEPLPVLLMWGGAADTFSMGFTSVDFEENSLDFSEALREDGSFVAHCDHGGGHTLPMDFEDAMAPWLFDHRFGQPSPFAGGIDGFPSYCYLPGDLN